MNITDLVGKRCLLRVSTSWDSGTVDEYKVSEISPSERFVKLMTSSGDEFWWATNGIRVIEVLKDLPEKETPPFITYSGVP